MIQPEVGPLTALKIHHNSKYREKLKYPASSLSPKTKNRFPFPFNSNIQNHYRKPSDLDSSPSFQHHCLKTKRTFQTTLEFPRSYPHLFSFSHLLYSCLHLFLSLSLLWALHLTSSNQPLSRAVGICCINGVVVLFCPCLRPISKKEQNPELKILFLSDHRHVDQPKQQHGHSFPP